MKSYPPKATQFKTFIPVFLLCSAIMIHSCKKDYRTTKTKPDVVIEQAKAWYESNYPLNVNKIDGKLNTEGVQDLSQRVNPDWLRVRRYKKAGSDVIEMPVNASAKFGLAALINGKLTNRSYSRNYFLVLNDGKQYRACLMTVIADSDYVKNDTSKLAHNTYEHNDPDFSGKVLYLTPKGKYLGGYAYRNGQLVSPTTSSGGKTTQQVQNLNPNVLVQQCTDWYLDYYVDGEFWYSTYIGRTCAMVDDGNAPGGNPGNPSGGGAPPAPPCAPPTPPIQSAVGENHLTINFIPPPDPCTPVKPVVKDTIMTDPCNVAKTAATTTTNTMTTGNTSINNAFATAIGFGNSGHEAAFHVDKIGSGYTASTPVSSTESAAFSLTNITANTTAIGHSHDAGSFPQPSPYDVYQLGELSVSHNNIKTDLVVSATAKYALVVTDLNAFKAFFAKYNESYLQKDANGNFTGSFDDSKSLGKDIDGDIGQKAHDAYLINHAVNPDNPTSAESIAADIAGEEAGLVYFLGNYNTGITLLKADASGNFKSMHFAASTINGVTIYLPSPCPVAEE